MVGARVGGVVGTVQRQVHELGMFRGKSLSGVTLVKLELGPMCMCACVCMCIHTIHT